MSLPMLNTLTLLLLAMWLSCSQAGMYLIIDGRKFPIEATQRCFSVYYCVAGRDAKWRGLPNSSQIVWFSDEHCTGDSIIATRVEGSFSFAGTVLDKRVLSFMVREYSWFPLNGFKDFCRESALINSTLVSNSSSISGDVDNELETV